MPSLFARVPERSLVFSPLAWLKLQYFCHAGPTEVGGFGISNSKDLLYVRDLALLAQQSTPVTVRLDDEAVAGFFDACVDAGLQPAQFSRIWCHTHPGDSALPSGIDEETFKRCFGGCDWAVMFIVSRSGQSYARLTFNVGPKASLILPVQVDWAAWPEALGHTDTLKAAQTWAADFAANVQPQPFMPASSIQGAPSAMGPPLDQTFLEWPWEELWFSEWQELEPLDAQEPYEPGTFSSP